MTPDPKFIDRFVSHMRKSMLPVIRDAWNHENFRQYEESERALIFWVGMTTGGEGSFLDMAVKSTPEHFDREHFEIVTPIAVRRIMSEFLKEKGFDSSRFVRSGNDNWKIL